MYILIKTFGIIFMDFMPSLHFQQIQQYSLNKTKYKFINHKRKSTNLHSYTLVATHENWLSLILVIPRCFIFWRSIFKYRHINLKFQEIHYRNLDYDTYLQNKKLLMFMNTFKMLTNYRYIHVYIQCLLRRNIFWLFCTKHFKVYLFL